MPDIHHYTICPYPFFITHTNLVRIDRTIPIVTQPDTRLSPILYCTLSSVLVGDGELFLASEEGFPVGKELDVEVIENDVLACAMKVIDVEHSAHV